MEDEDRELTRKLARRRCWWPVVFVGAEGLDSLRRAIVKEGTPYGMFVS